MKLQGKIAVVNGASRGIGALTATLLAREGADVVITARTDREQPGLPGSLSQTADKIRELGRRALPIKADLTQESDIEAIAQKTIEAFGRADILVNCAANTREPMFEQFISMTAESWRQQIAVNLTAPFLLCRAFAPHMIKRGGGVIINVTSAAAWNEGSALPGTGGAPGVAYAASKAGLNRLTLGLRKELRPHKIAIVAVDPGFTATENAQSLVSAFPTMDMARAHPTDVPARTILYMATCPDPMWYTGKVIVAADFVREHNLL
jgi:NAD(P)-dependent dehydrogenase (short-subunit alcohol dehydrogenase family)